MEIFPNCFSGDGNPAAWLRLDGRPFGSVKLASGASLSAALAAADGKDSNRAFLLCILHGALHTGIGVVGQDFVAGFPRVDGIYAGEEGCVLGWIGLPAAVPGAALAPWSACPDMGWYDKYEARVGVLADGWGAGEGCPFRPWSAYSVGIPPSSEPVSLHIHREVHNLVFVQGRPGAVAGYLAAEKPSGVYAIPLHCGDVVLVRPNVRHNLFAGAEPPEFRFFVFNSTQSNYQDEAGSDYHVQERFHRAALDFRSRPSDTPLFFEVT